MIRHRRGAVMQIGGRMKIQGICAVAFAAVFLAGCPEQTTTTSTARARPAAAAPAPIAGRRADAAAGSFAPLEDRGHLFDYDRIRVPRRVGAYTWHAVELSEAHALRSIATGMLLLTGPDGLPIRLRYERHVEHTDGNWTWVGRDERGADAILTFGELAAFGTIPYRAQGRLRVTTANGRAWLVETVHNAATAHDARSYKPDYLMPPKMSDALLARHESPIEATGDSMQTTIIDLLLGYTPGFAAMVGGTSQAVTRLHNIVEVNNEAYANSRIDARVRLVATLQVNYPDNTSNADALEQLTGTDGSGPGNVPIPTSLAPLRAARETFGADLVSLVRRFNTPEHEGCGVAWLIGGGQTEITRDYEIFGYSVVSDSVGQQSPDDGRYCLDTTLAHELGHNLGAQHDIATARGENGTLEPEEYGRFPYSFGYKTDIPNGNFYTVMAYGDPGQAFAFVFSTPEPVWCGSPCGIADQADNARGLRQTIPVIATFRAAVAQPRAARNDVDGDGKTDLVFHDASRRQLIYWIMDGKWITRMHTVSGVGAGYFVGATGDLNADRNLDLVWTSAARDLYLWAGNGTGFASIHIGTYPAGWQLVGAGDIDGDRRSDLLFHNSGTRQFSYRIMRGTTVIRAALISGVGSGYSVGASGDVNADGKLDLIWTSAARDLYLWAGNGNTFTSIRIGTYPAGWALVGAGDIDGDGRSDLLFHNPATDQFSYRIMRGASVVRSALIGSGNGQYLGSFGDLDGDRKLDLVWTNAWQDLYPWLGNGTGFVQESIGYHASDWVMVR
jgi:peptidyl-Asp metalloendopeptidase